MIEISTVCGLVKEQFFAAALAYLLSISLVFSLLPTCSLLKTKRRQSSSQIRPILVIPLVLGLEPTCPKLFLSTVVNYLDLI